MNIQGRSSQLSQTSQGATSWIGTPRGLCPLNLTMKMRHPLWTGPLKGSCRYRGKEHLFYQDSRHCLLGDPRWCLFLPLVPQRASLHGVIPLGMSLICWPMLAAVVKHRAMIWRLLWSPRLIVPSALSSFPNGNHLLRSMCAESLDKSESSHMAGSSDAAPGSHSACEVPPPAQSPTSILQLRGELSRENYTS